MSDDDESAPGLTEKEKELGPAKAELAELEAIALSQMESAYANGDRLAIAGAVIASYQLGMEVPEWAHSVLANIFYRYIASNCDLDLNKEIGGKGGEREESALAYLRRFNTKFDRAIRIGHALDALEVQPPGKKEVQGRFLG